MTQAVLGVIGGSGLYQMADLEEVEEVRVRTVFGDPSDAVIRGRLGDTRLLFLPRHGRSHGIPPHRINYRANILALKQLGAQQGVSLSAVGSLRESVHPGDLVVIDQFIDRTRSRPSSFFDEHGVVAHVGLADPIDGALADAMENSARLVTDRVRRGGTYVCIEGPQFSTRAESKLYRSWGADVVGMTNLPEARLAREAELPYATLAMVTDFDCWHETEEAVTVEAVIAVLRQNAARAQSIVRKLADALPDPTLSPAASALANAIITPPDKISDRARVELEPLIGGYLRPK
jgi:5'-methylthioadenosine phosphorylase